MTVFARNASTPSALAKEPTVQTGPRLHPVVHAGRWIAADLCSTLMFVALYAVTHSVYLATGLAIAAGVAQIAYLKLRGSPIDVMQWMSLGLVVVFGGASLFTHDPRFIMLKPTLIYAALGAVMCKPGWMVRYVPPIALPWSGDVIAVFGYVWAGLMFLTGLINLGLAAHGDPRVWAWFIGVFPLTSKLLLFTVQYLTTRSIVIARTRAAAVA